VVVSARFVCNTLSVTHTHTQQPLAWPAKWTRDYTVNRHTASYQLIDTLQVTS